MKYDAEKFRTLAKHGPQLWGDGIDASLTEALLSAVDEAERLRAENNSFEEHHRELCKFCYKSSPCEHEYTVKYDATKLLKIADDMQHEEHYECHTPLRVAVAEVEHLREQRTELADAWADGVHNGFSEFYDVVKDWLTEDEQHAALQRYDDRRERP